MSFNFRAIFYGDGVYTIRLESQLKSNTAAKICEYPTGELLMNYMNYNIDYSTL